PRQHPATQVTPGRQSSVVRHSATPAGQIGCGQPPALPAPALPPQPPADELLALEELHVLDALVLPTPDDAASSTTVSPQAAASRHPVRTGRIRPEKPRPVTSSAYHPPTRAEPTAPRARDAAAACTSGSSSASRE